MFSETFHTITLFRYWSKDTLNAPRQQSSPSAHTLRDTHAPHKNRSERFRSRDESSFLPDEFSGDEGRMNGDKDPRRRNGQGRFSREELSLSKSVPNLLSQTKPGK